MDKERMAEIFESVKVLELEPEDVLVFRTPERLSDEQTAQVTQFLAAMFPERRCLILDFGADVEIMRMRD
jgi:hypothetical protein